MEFASMLSHLQQKFGDAIERSPEALVGDPFITVLAESWHDAAEFLKTDPAMAMDQLKLITGVDRGDVIESVYHVYSYTHFHSLTLKVRLDREKPEVQSIAELYGAADWHERECFDMVGIRYIGHPNLRRILLPEDWVGHPLQVGYQEPEEYHGVSNKA